MYYTRVGDQCLPLCEPGEARCGPQNECTDVLHDLNNCGSCGNVCPFLIGGGCINGSCQCHGPGHPESCTGGPTCVQDGCHLQGLMKGESISDLHDLLELLDYFQIIPIFSSTDISRSPLI